MRPRDPCGLQGMHLEAQPVSVAVGSARPKFHSGNFCNLCNDAPPILRDLDPSEALCIKLGSFGSGHERANEMFCRFRNSRGAGRCGERFILASLWARNTEKLAISAFKPCFMKTLPVTLRGSILCAEKMCKPLILRISGEGGHTRMSGAPSRDVTLSSITDGLLGLGLSR